MSVTSAAATSAASTTTLATSAPPTTIDPGTLPQTDAKPTTDGAQFKSSVLALWRAIVQDDSSQGEAFFFPLSAYRQVKALSDPDSDYRNRLLANYAADIRSLHQQLGADAAKATLVGIDVPESAAEWITPGVESNKGSYWRVYGTRIRYSANGVQGTMPVTSLISWRGEWYVVHLGPIR